MTSASIQKVRQAVAAHFHDGHLVRLLLGGSANMTALVSTGTGGMVLRIYLSTDHPRFTCELETLLQLASIDAPTPRPIRWGPVCPVFRTPFLVYPLLPGETLRNVARGLGARAVAKAVSQLMAVAVDQVSTLSAHSYGYLHVADPPFTGGETIYHRPEEYAVVVARHRLLESNLLARTVRVVEENIDTVSTTCPRLVHPDLKPNNVLIGPGGAAIIDWELPVGGHPMLSYGGLLAEGLPDPVLQDGLRQHLENLDRDVKTAAVTAGLLRCLETLSYLPANPSKQDGRKVRPDAAELTVSVQLLLDWIPR